MASCTNILLLVTLARNPVLVRQLLHLKAQVVHTGSTSIRVFVLVETVVLKTRLPHKTNHCIITFVALSAAVELVLIPHWE